MSVTDINRLWSNGQQWSGLNGLPNSLSGATTDVEGPSRNNDNKTKQGSGVTINLLHKLTELFAYTSTVASEAYQNLTGNSENTDAEHSYDYYDFDEVMQINAGDDLVDSEPPPPYDITWSPTAQDTIVTKDNNNKPSSRRKQIRVHRGRRVRHRSSSNASTNTLSFQCDDEDDEFLRFNYKLMDLIVEGRTALTSTVTVSDVEFLLSEEKEREERIMRELDSILSSTAPINSCYGYYSPISGHPDESVFPPPLTQYEFPVCFKANCPPNYGYVDNLAT
ncbi:12937_t:CDS:2, partial [Acaulospora colombiana]